MLRTILLYLFVTSWSFVFAQNFAGPVNIGTTGNTEPLTIKQSVGNMGIKLLPESNTAFSNNYLTIGTEGGAPQIFKFWTNNPRMDFESAGQIFFKTNEVFFQSNMAVTRLGDPNINDPNSKSSHTLPLESNLWNSSISAGELYYAGFQNRAKPGVAGAHYLAIIAGSRWADFRDGGEVMTLNSDLTVGIGTTDTKGYKLGVNGSAIFTRAVVKLYGSWPDYVFKKSYKLPTLHEIEEYIKQNHHLPEVPSVLDVEKNGVDLGITQVLLLKKIEELTLYLIDQNKQLHQQAKDIQLLKDRLKIKK